MTREFDPPYDSPIEETLAWNLSKYLADDVRLRKRVEVDTGFAKFYLDLVVESTSGGRRAFECDGRDYHKDPLRDECRDALILETKAVFAIYRFRGQDLHHHLDDCLYYVLNNDPWLFSWRGIHHIDLLASDEVRQVLDPEALPIGTVLPIVGYEIGEALRIIYHREGQRPFTSVMARRSLAGKPSFMHAFINFAARNSRCSFDDLYARFRQHRGCTHHDPGG
jgi:hypothetical protein